MIPSSIDKILPSTGKAFYLDALNKAKVKGYDDVVSHRIAWSVTKDKFKKNSEGLIALSEDFVKPELLSFSLNSDGAELVINGDGDGFFFEGTLANVFDSFITSSGFSRKFDEEALLSLAEQINSMGSTMPDFNHSELTKVLESTSDPEAILNSLKKRKGLITEIKAVVKDGHLWVRGKLDSRYKSMVNRLKGISIESLATNIKGGLVKGAKYLGFTFTDKPQMKQAKVMKRE